MQLDPAPRLRQPFPHDLGVMITLLHQLGPIFAIFGASDRDKSLDLKV